MVSTPKPNGFADHYPVFKWLFHWEYTQHFQTNPFEDVVDEDEDEDEDDDGGDDDDDDHMKVDNKY